MASVFFFFPKKFCVYDASSDMLVSSITAYLQDPIHSNEGSELIDISCLFMWKKEEGRLQVMLVYLSKIYFMCTMQCHLDDDSKA